MSKRPDTLETTVLAIELLRRIPRGRKVTASELQSQLKAAGIERELRTIQRQLESLSEHFEIDRDDRSKPYGYCWREQSKGLALLSLTPQESLLLGLAEAQLKHLLPARLMQSMDSFFAQARRNLGPTSTAKLEREWAQKVRVVATTQPLLAPKIKPGVFEAASEALYANRWLQVDYLNAKGKRAEHKVMPLGLAQQGPCLYLVCRFEGYDNERSLALHRIHKAQTTTQEFTRPPPALTSNNTTTTADSAMEKANKSNCNFALPSQRVFTCWNARCPMIKPCWNYPMRTRSRPPWWSQQGWNGGCGDLVGR